MSSDVETLSSVRRPIGWILCAGTGTIALLMCIAVSLHFSEKRLVNRHSQELRFSSLSERVLYYEQVMTMAVRLFAVTSDSYWEQRYQGNKTLRDEVATELDSIGHQLMEYRSHEGASIAEARVASLESRALQMVHEGRSGLALDLLLGEEYTDARESYSRGMHESHLAFTAASAEGYGNLLMCSRAIAIAACGGLSLLAIAWVLVARSLAKYVQEREARLREESRANEQMSCFMASTSHELRTPMTAIIGFSEELLSGENSEPERTDMIRTIRRNGEQLLDLINDLLDLSKIESGEFTVERSRFSLGDLLRSVHTTLSSIAREKGVDLEVRVDSIPAEFTSDVRRLRQILLNLAGNAVKFTSEGSVVLHASMDRNRSMLRVQVEDTGTGIRTEDLEIIFEPFRQVDSSMERRHGGTGLGLAISRRLAVSLGGELLVESEPGVGSMFELVLPCSVGGDTVFESAFNISATCDLGASLSRSLAHVQIDARILLVEDGEDNQRLIRHILTKCGASIEVVSNGLLGVEAFDVANASGEPFDLILMDMQMPIMNGYESTRVIRDRGYEGPIVALTAHAMATDRDLCIEAGCDEYETKPIERSRFLKRISRLLDRSRSLQD